MADLDDLFNSPPGQSSRPPPLRQRTLSPSLTPTPERRRLSSQPLFLSPNGTSTPIKSRHPHPPAGQVSRNQNLQAERREEIQKRMIYTPEPEVDPFEESAVTTGNLGVYDPLAPILGEDEPARKKRKPIPKIDAERLMSEYGLPALMKDAKRFKVRGKGHEAQDLKSLLSTYQIWAHRMFPRGDFMGTMGRVENVLRTRRMENAMKGYREAFHPPPPSPGANGNRTSSPNMNINFDSDPERDIRRTPSPTPGVNSTSHSSGGALFDEVDLDEMAAMEEMEREAASRVSGRGTGTGNGDDGDDGPPPQLEEEDDWEGLYD